MELNWSTFFLEIINFLVLVWILKRFLYKPVREIIEQRRQRINDTFNESQALREEANDLQQQYQTRLSGWEQEKIQAREKLHQEISAERTRLLKNLQTSLEQEREKARSLDERHITEVRDASQQEALAISVQFATRFLSRFKGPELESNLIEMFLEDLPKLPEEQQKKVRSEFEATQSTVTVSSVYPIEASERKTLENALKQLTGKSLTIEYRQDIDLLSGLRISIGSFVMRANLQDELQMFSEAARGSPR